MWVNIWTICKRNNQLQDLSTHFKLKNNLIDHLWAMKDHYVALLIILSKNTSFHSFIFCTCFHTFWKYFPHMYLVALFQCNSLKTSSLCYSIVFIVLKGPTSILIQSFSLSSLFIAFVNVLDSLSTITNDVIPCLHEAPCDAWHQQIHFTSLCLLLTSYKKLTNKRRKYIETFKLFKGWSYEVVKKTSRVISMANCCLWAIYNHMHNRIPHCFVLL